MNDTSFIISTNGKNNQTVQSVPKESEVVISTSKPLGRARNDGIQKSTRKWIAVVDDDITFTPVFLSYLNQLKSEDRIITLESYWPSPFGLGRFMFFNRSAYNNIGKFNEISHGDETEWIVRAMEKGYKLVRIPRESVTHIPHTQSKPKSGDFLNLARLISKHPLLPFYLVKTTLEKMKYSSDRKEYNGKFKPMVENKPEPPQK